MYPPVFEQSTLTINNVLESWQTRVPFIGRSDLYGCTGLPIKRNSVGVNSYNKIMKGH